MKLVKIVKYQRVRYGDLEEGAEYLHKGYSGPRIKGDTDSWHSHNVLRPAGRELVGALDTDKYPPEVTYNIEGIPEERIKPLVGVVGATSMRLFIPHMDESEIETRYV